MIPLKDSHSTSVFPLVTVGLIAVNIWAFIQEITAFNPDTFITNWALIPAYHPAQNSKLLKKGESFSLVFDQVGIYPYHCSAHEASMIGSLIVE